MGALIGFIFGMIMMPLAFIIFYVTTLGVRHEAFVFLLNTIAAALSVIQVSSLAWHGLYSYDAWQNTAAMLPPELIGLCVGTRLRRRLSEMIFECLVLCSLESPVFFLSCVSESILFDWAGIQCCDKNYDGGERDHGGGP